MIHYITSFIIYTLAMAGLLIIGFVVYKKTVPVNPVRKNPLIKIEDMLRLPDRKVLYVVNCMGERFLLASSNDRVTFVSKVDNNGIKRGNDADIERYLSEKQNDSGEDSESKKHLIKNLLKELSDKNQSKRGNF